MKYSISILAATLCLTMHSANAQNSKAELLGLEATVKEKASAANSTSTSSEYGVYQLQSELVAVPQALADRSASKKDIGNMTLVARAVSTGTERLTEFRRNSVVRNAVTGELGVITGNISVLSSRNADINDLLQQFQLKVVRSASSSGVYIVQPKNDVDLVALVEQINSSGLVSKARLDIIEEKYTNQ
ncbi:hypothetical protein J2X32_003463 [Rheinheimera pacifica]|uniref:hypothetical protein n=1 Tax=Rheinheimera pacifica TaxID=173990 RepID=UPI0028570C70|nr:hypothetical protein [Rheinheimera pacifica]MDR6984808.1 hypothetical protein [Rheinheimera pacifica]